MRRHLLPVMVVVLSAVFVVACGGGGDPDPVAAPVGDLDGAALYSASCASCHGADLQGTDKGPSHLSIVYEPNHHPDEAFRSAIRNGAAQHHWDFGDMPPVAGLTDDEVESIIAFVRAEQEAEGFQR